MSGTCSQHSGCIARINALEERNRIQDKKLEENTNTLNQIRGIAIIVPIILTIIQLCFVAYKVSH